MLEELTVQQPLLTTTGDAVAQSPRGMTDIQEANYRVDTTSVDTPMTRISRSQYQAFSNKTSLGLPLNTGSKDL